MASGESLDGSLSAFELRKHDGGRIDRMVEQIDFDGEIELWKDALWYLVVCEWMSFPFGDDFIIDWYDQLNGE